MASFGPWDYTILIIVLMASASIGVYYRLTGGKQKTTNEFLLADRSMPVLPVAFSLMASFMSAVTLLGLSMEIYQFGTMFVLINIAYIIATPIGAYLILPVFYRLKTASVYEYLEARFGYTVRLMASLAFSLQMILYMGIVLFAPALALEAVTGLNQIFSIFIIGIVCTFYATIGGMKAVLVTDMLQSLLMYTAIFSVIICAAIKAGGLDVIWETAREGGRIEFLKLSVDPTTRHSLWTQIFGGMATYLAIYGVNQTQVQRLLSVRNLKSSQASLWWSLPILMLLSFSTCFSGLCIYYYYRDCDPLLEGRIGSRDQVMPLFVVDTMSHIPGISGLFVSGIFSASLSTISSAISSLSAVTLEDYIKPLVMLCSHRVLDDSKTIWYSKVLSVLYGVICIGIAFLAKSMGGVLQASLSIFGIIGGPLLGLFTLGMYIKSANQKGAVTGLIIGLAVSFWVGFGQPKPPTASLPMSTDGCPIQTATASSHVYSIFTAGSRQEETNEHYFYLYRISYMWYAVLGFFCTFLVGMIASWLYAWLRWDSNAHIYTDSACTLVKYDLFVPPIANRLRRQQMPVVVVTGASSEAGGGGGSSTPSTIGDDTQMTIKSISGSIILNGTTGGVEEDEQQQQQQQRHRNDVVVDRVSNNT